MRYADGSRIATKPGQNYQAKLVELQAAKAAGDLTQAQFDRYDAELVNCLNDAP